MRVEPGQFGQTATCPCQRRHRGRSLFLCLFAFLAFSSPVHALPIASDATANATVAASDPTVGLGICVWSYSKPWSAACTEIVNAPRVELHSTIANVSPAWVAVDDSAADHEPDNWDNASGSDLQTGGFIAFSWRGSLWSQRTLRYPSSTKRISVVDFGACAACVAPSMTPPVDRFANGDDGCRDFVFSSRLFRPPRCERNAVFVGYKR